jgi:hypothetical protein
MGANLASRKLVAGILATLLIALNTKLQLGLDAGQLDWIGTLALTVIGSQGVVDVMKTRGGCQQ